MKFEYEDIKFLQERGYVQAIFLEIFGFQIKDEELWNLGHYTVEKEAIIFEEEKVNERKFNDLINKGFTELTNLTNEKPTTYVHKNSGIPLMGNVSFGIIDRGSNIIEIKPITSCNIDCVFCSVNETKRERDFVVEADYLVEEVAKLIAFKECDDIEIHVGCQGEPLRYSKLDYLVSELRKIKEIKRVSIDTNATFLTKTKIDSMIKAGFTRLNISLNAIDSDLAREIAVLPYNVSTVLDAIKYASSKDVEVVVAPVWVKGINDDQIEKIVKFVVELGKKQKAPTIGIQKYLYYPQGKKYKEMEWDEFFDKLKELEKRHNVKLILDETDFNVVKTKELPKPFKKNAIIEAEVKCQGRMRNEKIAVSENRTISFIGNGKNKVKLKITRTKHNIFKATLIN